MAVKESVAPNIDVKAYALRQPKLELAVWEINPAVIKAHMLSLKPDWRYGFQ
jgi:hypothetical protein